MGLFTSGFGINILNQSGGKVAIMLCVFVGRNDGEIRRCPH